MDKDREIWESKTQKQATTAYGEISFKFFFVLEQSSDKHSRQIQFSSETLRQYDFKNGIWG